MRVSTLDQHPETQMYDLRGLAAQRGFEIVAEDTDRISGAKVKRPGLDRLLADARLTSSTDSWSRRFIAFPVPRDTFWRCSTN
jgi:DNA invertase Pin-like site-specific DNA recombinase